MNPIKIIMETKETSEVKKKSIEKWPKVAIIILNWNGWKDTIECLESVFRNTYPNYQVIVVDNGSTDGSIEKIKAWADGKQTHPLYHLSHPPVEKPIPYIYYTREEAERGGNLKFEEKVTREWQEQKKSNSKELNPTSPYPLIFIQTGKNLGFAGGNNIALNMMLNRNECKYIWLLNPDIIIEKDTLEKIVNFAYKRKKNIIGCTIKNYFNTKEVLFYGGAKINFYTGTISFIKREEDIKKLDYISGGSLFTEIDNFKKIGLLPEEYFLYWEETDWCTKAILDGIMLKVCLGATCYDKISTTIGKGYIAEYYYTLGALNFLSKYHSNKIKFVLFTDILRIVKRVIKLKIENAKAIINAIKIFLLKLY